MRCREGADAIWKEERGKWKDAGLECVVSRITAKNTQVEGGGSYTIWFRTRPPGTRLV